MASRATIRCSTRQSEFCGEDTTAGVDMRKLRFRGRAYCPGGGVPSRTVSPHPVPHQRDGIGHESRRRTGTTEGDKPRWTRLAAMERESAGRGVAHLKTGGAHRAPPFSTPADGAAVAADDASRSAVLREDAPRPSARNVPHPARASRCRPRSKVGSPRRWPADEADGKPARVFPVSPEKQQALAARMRVLGVREADLEEHFVRSGGKGGQNVNKVSTCVVLRHRPSGVIVKCQRERSQALNRFLARRELLDKLEARARGVAEAAAAERARIRRQQRRRSRRAQEKLAAARSTSPRRAAAGGVAWSACADSMTVFPAAWACGTRSAASAVEAISTSIASACGRPAA